MEIRPSLVLPAKRLRSVIQKSHPILPVNITNKNKIKAFAESEKEKISLYVQNNPGEFYKVNYWTTAISQGLLVNEKAETLRLFWMNYMNSKSVSVNFTLSVNVSAKENHSQQAQELNQKIIICNSNGKRKIYDVAVLKTLANEKRIVEKFGELLEKCKKVSKTDVPAKELLELLKRFKGKSKDVLVHLVGNSPQHQIKSIYEDCCSLSKQTIPYSFFLSLYIKYDGSITTLYMHFSKINKGK